MDSGDLERPKTLKNRSHTLSPVTVEAFSPGTGRAPGVGKEECAGRTGAASALKRMAGGVSVGKSGARSRGCSDTVHKRLR